MKPVITRTLLLLTGCFLSFNVYATVYEIVSSGNFTSASIWKNGNVPPGILGANDTVYIGSGVTGYNVILNRDISLNNSNCYMRLFTGSRLEDTSGSHFLSIQQGLFQQGVSSTLVVDSLYYSSTANTTSTFGGIDTINKLTLSAANFVSGNNAVTIVKDLLHLKDGVCAVNREIQSDSGLTIFYSDGGGLAGSQAVSTTNFYSVKYGNENTATNNAFDELKGSGTTLTDIEVTDSADIVLLPAAQELELKGELRILSGTVRIGDGSQPYYVLRLTGYGRFGYGGRGTFTGSDSLDVIFNTSALYSFHLGFLRFSPGYNKLRSLKMRSQPSPNILYSMLVLTGDLEVGTLEISAGRLIINNNRLNITGPAGSLVGGDDTSHIIVFKDGRVRCNVTPNVPFTFPIGSSSRYLPVTIIPTTTIAEAGVGEEVYEYGTNGDNITATQPVVKGTWYFEDNTYFTSIKPGWSTKSEVNSFDNKMCYVSMYNNGSWDAYPVVPATTLLPGYLTVERQDNFIGGVYAVFDVNTRVSVEELLKQNDGITIYPNPVRDQLYFTYHGDEEVAATVVDISGKVVANSDIAGGEHSIDVSHLSAGTYFLQLAGNSSTHKFCKQ